MTTNNNETLEEYVEWFNYNLHRSPHTTLLKKVLRVILIKGMKEESVETINLMGKGDISQENYDEIIHLCIKCSRGSTPTGTGSQDPMSKGSKPHSGGIMQMEIGNLLEDFKTDILSILIMQLDVLHAKQKTSLSITKLGHILSTLSK